jgi:hypothetical protein
MTFYVYDDTSHTIPTVEPLVEQCQDLDATADVARQHTDNIYFEHPDSRDPVGDHVILVAFQIDGRTSNRRDAEITLGRVLQPVLASRGGPVECWWVAEDVRHDGSDCDSAVFVTPGAQYAAARLLQDHGLTASCNGYDDDRNGQFEAPEAPVTYQERFEALYRAVAACEAPEGTQVDDVLGQFQAAYDEAVGR